MPTLILVRHGQSQWNLENRFTGWVDIDLSPQGIDEAEKAGEKLKGYAFDFVYTSVLIRAIRTWEIISKIAQLDGMQPIKDKALNERMYGDLQGLNKDETRTKFGDEQVHLWRRSYDIAPPNGESLKMTLERVLPYYKINIEPKIKEGKNILIVAHGNSLRALMKHLEHISDDEITKLEIPTGAPIQYVLDNNVQIINKTVL